MTGNGNNGSHSERAPIFSPMHSFALPPEAWYLVTDPKITKSEIKVTLCVLFNSYGNGVEGGLLSFTDIQQQTGMSSSSVFAGLEAGLRRASIFKRTTAGQIFYEPASKKSEAMTCHDHDINSNKNFKATHENQSCHVSEIEARQKIFAALLEFGLATHVAENIAMSNRYKLEVLQEQLAYVQFEHEQGLLPKRQSAIPGYIVNRIKYDRIPPQGYTSGGDSWYTAEEAAAIQR